MHQNDQMTPVVRARALAEHKAVDRMPISLFYGAPAHALLGWTRQQESASGRSMAQVQEKVYETFGADGVGVNYGLHGMAVAFGAIVSQEPHVPLSILRPPLETLDDLSALDLDLVTVCKDPTASKCFEAAKILQDELGQEVGCGMGFPAPFTAASGLIGVERLLRDIQRKPEQVHALLDFTTQALIQLAIPFIKEGIGISLADPVASGSILSRKNFLQFCAPYSKRIVDAAKTAGALPVSCHICGNISSILQDIAQCGYDTISVDNVMDLAQVKGAIGASACIMGNLDPVTTLYQGSPQEVRQAVRDCYRVGWDSPKGYIVCFGCDASYGTPLENVYAFMDEARKCAKYPVTPANFE